MGKRATSFIPSGVRAALTHAIHSISLCRFMGGVRALVQV
jgi:hypothetical protein